MLTPRGSHWPTTGQPGTTIYSTASIQTSTRDDGCDLVADQRAERDADGAVRHHDANAARPLPELRTERDVAVPPR